MILLGSVLIMVAAGVMWQVPGRPPATPVDDLLRASATYLSEYERQMSAVVSEEHYQQRATTRTFPESRTLRSDVLVIADEGYGWIGFRDVYEVDGRRVRDRDERLVRLFLKPNPDRERQVRRIVEESTRFNLNAGGVQVQRSINMPMMALRFLRGPNQDRSSFTLEGREAIDGVTSAVVSFLEHGMPRIIRSADDAAARGRFWIDPASGRVLRTSLLFETRDDRISITSRIEVAFAPETRLGLWVPVSMTEEHKFAAVVLTGRALYSNFRRFSVDVGTEIK